MGEHLPLSKDGLEEEESPEDSELLVPQPEDPGVDEAEDAPDLQPEPTLDDAIPEHQPFRVRTLSMVSTTSTATTAVQPPPLTRPSQLAKRTNSGLAKAGHPPPAALTEHKPNVFANRRRIVR